MSTYASWQVETIENLTPPVNEILQNFAKNFSPDDCGKEHAVVEAFLKAINDRHRRVLNGLDASLFFSFRNMRLNNNEAAFIVNTIVQLVPHFEQGIAEIDFSGNRITKIPASIGNIKTLKSLKLNGNSALKHLPKSLAKLTGLKIHFRDTGITNLSPWPVKPVKPRAPKAAAAPAEAPAVEIPAPAVITAPDNSAERHSLHVGQSFYVQNISMPTLPAEIENESADSPRQSLPEWEKQYEALLARLKRIQGPWYSIEGLISLLPMIRRLFRGLNTIPGLDKTKKLNVLEIIVNLLLCFDKPDKVPGLNFTSLADKTVNDPGIVNLERWPILANNLGVLFYAADPFYVGRAKACLELALSRLRARLGDYHPDSLPILNNLIAVAFASKDYKKAEELCWSALAIVQADSPKGMSDIAKFRRATESAFKFCTALAIVSILLGKQSRAVSIFDEINKLLTPMEDGRAALYRSLNWLNIQMACYLEDSLFKQASVDALIDNYKWILAVLEKDQDFYSANKNFLEANLANIKEIAALAKQPTQFLLEPVTTTKDFPRHFNDINFDDPRPITCSLPTSFTLKAKLID
jgi:hypothetical protein